MAMVASDGPADIRRGGAAWFLLVAVACGLAAAWVAVRSVSAARREVPALLVRRTVAPLSRVSAADVAVASVPAAALPAGALRSASAAVGKFTRIGLVPGEVVTTGALSGGVTGASAFDVRLSALALPTGCSAGGGGAPPGGGTPSQGQAGPPCRDLVAMTVPVSADQGFAMVHSGDRVDVAASYTVQQGPVAQIVVQDVPVLDRLANAQQGPANAAGPSSGWLVLAVSPVQALRLQLAEAGGKLSVLLRPAGAARQGPSDVPGLMTLTQLGGDPASAVAPRNGGTLPLPGTG